MDWTNDVVLQFLELYQMHPCIWDPQMASHKNKTIVNDAWCEIKRELGFPGTIKELKKKKESLMSAYRGYKAKIKKSEMSGSGVSDIYKPTWFAFELMDSFLGSVIQCKQSLSQGDHDQNQALNENSNQTIELEPVTDASASNLEHQPVSNPSSQIGAVTQTPSTSQSQQITMTTTRRRQHDPPELTQAKNQMDKAFKILETVSQRQSEDDDECNIFGKLIAKKLRRLPVNRRDLMMIKINNLIYEEIISTEYEHQDRPNSSSSTRSYPSTSSTISKIEYENRLTSDIYLTHNTPKSSSSSHPYKSSPSPLSTTVNEKEMTSNLVSMEPSPTSKTENNNTMSLPSDLEVSNQPISHNNQPNQPRFILTEDGFIIREDLIQESDDTGTYAPNVIYEGPAENLKEFIISLPPKKQL